MLRDIEFTELDGGNNNIVALTTKGEAYIWGEFTREIIDDQNDIVKGNRPTLVPHLSDYHVDKASISQNDLIVIAHEKRDINKISAFGFGENVNRQSGGNRIDEKYLLPVPRSSVPYLISLCGQFSLVFYKAPNYFANADTTCEFTKESPIQGALFALNTPNGAKFYSVNARDNPNFPPLVIAFTHPIQKAKSFKFPSLENCQLVPMEANIDCAKCKTQIKGPLYIPCVKETKTAIICERCFLNKIYGPNVCVYYRINKDHVRPSIGIPIYSITDFYDILDDAVKIEQTIKPNCRFITHPKFSESHKKGYDEFLKSMAKFQEKHDVAIFDLLNAYTRENDVRFAPRNRIEINKVIFLFIIYLVHKGNTQRFY